MNDISFDKNVVLTRLTIAKNNYEKIVEQRNAFVDFLCTRIIKTWNLNPFTWLFPKMVPLNRDMVKYFIGDNYNCANVSHFENEVSKIKNLIDYLESSFDRDIKLSIVDFNKINGMVKASYELQNMNKYELEVVEFFKKTFYW